MRATIIVLLLSGCVTQISGHRKPTENTFKLTSEQIATAYATLDACRVQWITTDPQANRDRALSELGKRGIRIKERRVLPFLVSGPLTLNVARGFWERSIPRQAESLSHEIVHYCDRDDEGLDFEKRFFDEAERFTIETPAIAQQIETRVAHGMTRAQGEAFIPWKQDDMLDMYWLHGIDPAQFRDETHRMWSEVLPDEDAEATATDPVVAVWVPSERGRIVRQTQASAAILSEPSAFLRGCCSNLGRSGPQWPSGALATSAHFPKGLPASGWPQMSLGSPDSSM